MAAPRHILFLSDTACRVGTIRRGGASLHELECDGACTLADAPRVVALLREQGHAGRPVLMAIPSHWCFAATLPASPDLPRHDRKALLYRLEEQLPIAAEQLVADFIHLPDGSILGLAARADLAKPWIDALEQSGIPIASITPTALLAAQDLASSQPSAILLLDTQSPRLIDQITVQDGRPVTWHLVSPATASAAPAIHAALQMGSQILAGSATPFVEFRRDSLAPRDALSNHRRALDALLACAAMLFLALTASFLIRAHRYDMRAAALEKDLSSQFSTAFPDWPVPANVRSVLASEHRKALAETPAASTGTTPGSALRTLYAVIKSLPTDVRVQLTRINATDSAIDFDGRAPSLESLDTLSASLRAVGLQPAPPQARKDVSNTWSFTLRAALPDTPLTSTKELQ